MVLFAAYPKSLHRSRSSNSPVVSSTFPKYLLCTLSNNRLAYLSVYCRSVHWFIPYVYYWLNLFQPFRVNSIRLVFDCVLNFLTFLCLQMTGLVCVYDNSMYKNLSDPPNNNNIIVFYFRGLVTM